MAESQILQGQRLQLHNVLSCRGQLKPEEIQNFLVDLEEVIERNRVQPADFMVMIIHGEDVETNDMEILIPLDRKIQDGLEPKYKFSDLIEIRNAIKINHKGNPCYVQATMEMLSKYMRENSVEKCTPVYCRYVKMAQSEEELDESLIEIYVGVKNVG